MRRFLPGAFLMVFLALAPASFTAGAAQVCVQDLNGDGAIDPGTERWACEGSPPLCAHGRADCAAVPLRVTGDASGGATGVAERTGLSRAAVSAGSSRVDFYAWSCPDGASCAEAPAGSLQVTGAPPSGGFSASSPLTEVTASGERLTFRTASGDAGSITVPGAAFSGSVAGAQGITAIRATGTVIVFTRADGTTGSVTLSGTGYSCPLDPSTPCTQAAGAWKCSSAACFDDSAGGRFQTSDRICGSDLDGDGALDFDTEVLKCSAVAGGDYCPVGAVACTLSSAAPGCPAGGAYNPAADRCEAQTSVSYACPLPGGSACAGDPPACTGTGACTYGFSPDPALYTAVVQSPLDPSLNTRMQAQNGQLRGTGSSGEYGAWIPVVAGDSLHSTDYHWVFSWFQVQTRNGQIRLCWVGEQNLFGYDYTYYNLCGAWVPVTGSGASTVSRYVDAYYGTYTFSLQVSGGQARFAESYGNEMPGPYYSNWVPLGQAAWTCSAGGASYGSQAACEAACTATAPCTAQGDCPAGYTLAGGLCAAPAQCEAGSALNPGTDLCEGTAACPLGGYACLPEPGTGVKKCSPNPCVQVSSITPEHTDAGGGSYRDDGGTDADGNCLGTVYIYNGRPSQCRPAGVQTNFFNCCDASQGSLLFIREYCGDGDAQTVQAVSAGLCHEVGSYCRVKWKFVGCVQRARTYCCFNSKLGRIIHEQGRAQLAPFGPGGGWGSPEAAECRGFTPQEFQSLDFSKIDLSEYVSGVQEGLGAKVQSVQQRVEQGVRDHMNRVR